MFLFFFKYICLAIIVFLDIDWLKLLPLLLPLIMSVAFFTVFERKVLASCSDDVVLCSWSVWVITGFCGWVKIIS